MQELTATSSPNVSSSADGQWAVAITWQSETPSNSSVSSQCVPRLKPGQRGATTVSSHLPWGAWGPSSFYAETKPREDSSGPPHCTLPPHPPSCRAWWPKTGPLQHSSGLLLRLRSTPPRDQGWSANLSAIQGFCLGLQSVVIITEPVP